jgi:hypothetical protein
VLLAPSIGEEKTGPVWYTGRRGGGDLLTEVHYDGSAGTSSVEPGPRQIIERTAPRDAEGNPIFAHASEAEFARILDFYQIRWEYEPRSFAIEWDAQGTVTRYFTPDFYLPEFDLYLELTTLRQKLVTKKNQKIRRLRELYPGIKIKLFYRRDIRHLFSKYGVRLPLNDQESTP